MKKVLIVLCISVLSVANAQTSSRVDGIFESHEITLSTGIRMHYLHAGKPNGEVVVFLHGYTDTNRSFRETVRYLLSLNSNLSVYVPDLRGHGKTSMPDGEECPGDPASCFTPVKLAKDVLAFTNQLKLEKFKVVSHSMGTIVAQELALLAPTRVSKVVLIGGFVNGTNMPFINDFIIDGVINKTWKPAFEAKKDFVFPNDAFQLRPLELEPVLKDWIKTDWVVDPTASRSLIDSIYYDAMELKLGTWMGAMQALSKVDNRERLKDLSVPVLVLWAIQDNACPESVQKELMAALLGAVKKNGITCIFKTYGKVPLPESGLQETDLGHNPQWGAPEEIAKDIDIFFRKTRVARNWPYANPENLEEIIVGKEDGNITVIKP